MTTWTTVIDGVPVESTTTAQTPTTWSLLNSTDTESSLQNIIDKSFAYQTVDGAVTSLNRAGTESDSTRGINQTVYAYGDITGLLYGLSAINSIFITADQQQASHGEQIAGFQVVHAVGGVGASGSRSAIHSRAAVTGAISSEPNNDVVSMLNTGYSISNQGGDGTFTTIIDDGYVGSLWGNNSNVWLANGATYYRGVYGTEINCSIMTGGSSYAKGGILIAKPATDTVRAVNDDAAIMCRPVGGRTRGPAVARAGVSDADRSARHQRCYRARFAPFRSADSLPRFDFATVPDATAWEPTHDIAQLVPESDGLRVHISGRDPYLYGPSRNYPAGKLLWLHLRLKSDQGGGAQVFYFTRNPTEDKSVRFTVPAGVLYDVQVPMPALDGGWRLRIDPPGDGGTCLLSRLWFEERVVYPPPMWPVPSVPDVGPDPVVVETAELRVVHNRTKVGGFRLESAGEFAAIGHTGALVGYVVTNQVRWMTLGNAPGGNVSVQPSGSGLSVHASWHDPDGARWDLRLSFVPTKPSLKDHLFASLEG